MNFTLKRVAGILFFLAISSNMIAAEGNQTVQTQAEQTEISDAELEKFGQAFQAMRVLNQEIQQEMTTLVADEGMEVMRFNEIHQGTIDPAKEVEATDEEMEQYKNITAEIEKRQVDFQKRMEGAIKKGDMTLERYQEIATQLQNDPELQERLRKSFQN